MKNIYKYLLLPICLLSTSCNWFPYWNEEVKTELEKLPPATQSGENTFGCLVNGKAFVPPDSYSMTAIFQQGQLQLGATIDNDVKTESISINIGDPLHERVVYKFNEIDKLSGYTYKDKEKTCIYQYGSSYGQIYFTNIDRINYIVSGTFEFSTANDDCDTIQITDGRFDVQYIP